MYVALIFSNSKNKACKLIIVNTQTSIRNDARRNVSNLATCMQKQASG